MAQRNLTTVPKVKAYLRQPLGADAELVVEDFIVIASRMVREYTRRRFSTPRVREVREFRSYGLETVYIDELLSKGDLLSVTDEAGLSLEADTDFTDSQGGSGNTKGCVLTTQPLYGAYGGLSALPADHGDLFTRNLVDPGATSTLNSVSRHPRVIRVDGTFGYDELDALAPTNPIPPDVEFATRRAVALWYKEEIAHYTQDAFISRGRMFEPDMLPPISASMLRPWKVDTPLIF